MTIKFAIEPSIMIPMVTAGQQFSADAKSLVEYIPKHYDTIMQQLNQHGALLFRGFGCENEAYFSETIDVCGLGERCSTLGYDFPRTILKNHVYTSSNLPGDVKVYLHHEKPRSKEPPDHIYFCCIVPPAYSGGTLFANASLIWQDIPPNIQQKILENGVLYKQFFHGASYKFKFLQKLLNNTGIRSWPDYFSSHDKKNIEMKLAGGEAAWKWVNRGQDLVLYLGLPGARQHPLTHQMLWFNSAAYLNYYMDESAFTLKNLPKYLAKKYLKYKDGFSLICHYGDGRPFNAHEIKIINDILIRHTKVFNWQKGDFMIVDNFTYMHGKQPHQGERLLYSCMTKLP